MARQVPDVVLRDHVIAYSGQGLAQYVASEWNGETLRLTVRFETRRAWVDDRWWTHLTILGMQPVFDHMGSASPAMWLRLYAGDTELTDQIVQINYMRPDLVLPERGAAADQRYPSLWEVAAPGGPQTPVGPDGLRIPANWGGLIVLPGNHPTLTGVCIMRPRNRPRVVYMGTETFYFQSYIGPGNVGALQPLMEQLRARYPLRHPRFELSIPEGANYVLFNYPPTPYDVYDPTSHNLDRPSAGTVRLAPDDGMLSQDFTHGGAFPLLVAWQDADQSAGPYLSLLPPVNRVTPPEYVVPPGIPYDPCFLRGDCGTAVLEAIYHAQMPLQVSYLRVKPHMGSGVQALPLRVADDLWSPAVGLSGWQRGRGATATDDTTEPSQRQGGWPHHVYLPRVAAYRVPAERPLGLFEMESKRMIGYLP
jgi:hypothetical protein